MPAIARTSEFKNCTFKRVVAICLQKNYSLAAAITTIGKNFPTKIGTDKKVQRLTRALATYQSQYFNGKLTFQEMKIIPVPPPLKRIYMKGLEPKRVSKPKTDKPAVKKLVIKKPAKKSAVAKKKSAAKPAKTTEPEVIDLT
jgi:hypothetical protein